MKKAILIFFVLATWFANAQTSCDNALPFCAGGVSGITFPATTSTPQTSAEQGPFYDCLLSTPNPAWYYLQINNSGSLDILIQGQIGAGPGQDVDFIAWGPFSSLTNICNNLTANNTIDCSYSGSYTETLNIANGVSGQYYLVLITNYANVQQNIIFNQIGGNGTTDCSLLANNSIICAGASATVSTTNASNLTNPSYSIQPGGTINSTGSFVVSPSTTTEYTLFITGTNGIGASITQTAVSGVTVNPQPMTALTLTQTTCTSTLNAFNLGLSFNPLNATPGYTVSWPGSTPNGISSYSQTSLTGGIAPGVYTAVVTTTGGCSASATITINPLPAPSVFTLSPPGSSYTVTCAQPTIVLDGSEPGYTYNWNNGIVAPMTGTTTNYTSMTLGNWTVTGTNPVSGCVSVHTFTVFLNTTVPTSSVSPVNQNIPCGPGIVATATGVAISPTTNVTHSWSSPGSPVPVTSGGPMSIYSPPIVSGTVTISTYVLTDNINGCSTTKTIQVVSTGGSYPTFSLTSNQQFTVGCTTTSLTNIVVAGGQSGSGGVISYTLLPPGYAGGTSYTTGPNQTFPVSQPGTYTVVVKDNANLCESRLPVSIVQNTFSPSISADAITRTLSCAVPSVVLAGNSTNTPVDYQWSFQNAGNPNIINNFSLTVNTNTATLLTSTVVNTYTLRVTDQNNACVSFTTVTIWQNTRPPLPLITPPVSSISCAPNSSSVNLTNFSSTGILPNTFFISQPLVGLLWEGPTPQLPKQNASSYLGYTPGTYTMTVIDMNNGCTAKATATITDERDYPVIMTPSVVSLDCGASNTGGVKLPITLVGLAPSAVTALWTPPMPPPNVSGLNTLTLTTDGIGVYKISVTTNSNSCRTFTTVQVVNGALTAGFTADQETGFAPLTVNFTNSSASSLNSNSITSVWSFGNGTVRTTTTNVATSAIYTQPGTYTVTMFASKGSCLDTATKVIVVDIPSKLEVPNVFTPNGDNSNDLFFVRASNLTDITAQIFDRWGNKIYELTSGTGNIAWDGKNQSGKEVPDGTYFYTIKAKGLDGQSYDTKGTVSLYR